MPSLTKYEEYKAQPPEVQKEIVNLINQRFSLYYVGYEILWGSDRVYKGYCTVNILSPDGNHYPCYEDLVKTQEEIVTNYNEANDTGYTKECVLFLSWVKLTMTAEFFFNQKNPLIRFD